MIAFAPFVRSLAEPFVYGGRSVTERRGFILRRGDFFAEASPLPGHSADTLTQVERALRHGEEPPASLRFALAGLAAQESPGPHPVRSNALSRGENLPALRAAGYTHVKLKISPENWRARLGLVESHPEFLFRLDANLSLTPADLAALFEEVIRRNLEERLDYLEEPFAGVWRDPAFRGGPLALAADETAEPALLAAPNPPAVFVVKPTVAGSLAEYGGRRVVYTSALEAEPGRRALLALLSQKPTEVAGLATGFLFRENFLPDQAEWTAVPPIGAEERAWLESLPWEEAR